MGLWCPYQGTLVRQRHTNHSTNHSLPAASQVAVIIAYPIMAEYVALRSFVITHSVALVKKVCPHPGKPKNKLDQQLAILYGAALLRFNFVYGDLI